MGLLDGKTALIFGVANDHSIAWGIAQALHAEGAEVGFSSVESLIEKRVRPLAASIGSTFVEACDVQSDEQIRAVFARWGETHDVARHPRPRARLRPTRGPRGRVRRHLARRVRARARRLGVLARRARARGAAAPPTRVVGHDADLLRRREGRRQLQRDGRREGRARGVGPLPRGRPRAGRDPRQRDQRRPGPDARRGGDRRLQGDVPRRSPTSRRCGRTSRPRTSAGAPSISPRTCRARSPARCSTWTAGSTSWASRPGTETP